MILVLWEKTLEILAFFKNPSEIKDNTLKYGSRRFV